MSSMRICQFINQVNLHIAGKLILLEGHQIQKLLAEKCSSDLKGCQGISDSHHKPVFNGHLSVMTC